MIETHVEKPGGLVCPGLGVNTHTEEPANLVIGIFLLNGQYSR